MRTATARSAPERIREMRRSKRALGQSIPAERCGVHGNGAWSVSGYDVTSQGSARAWVMRPPYVVDSANVPTSARDRRGPQRFGWWTHGCRSSRTRESRNGVELDTFAARWPTSRDEVVHDPLQRHRRRRLGWWGGGTAASRERSA